MVRTFEEIRTRIPANLNEPRLEALMPEAAWEALLRDAVQGLCRPYTPRNLRRWLQTTHLQAWATGVPQAPPQPHHHHTGEGKGNRKGRARDGKGHPARGRGGGQGNRQAPTGTGQRGQHNTGAGNHKRAKKGKDQGL